MFSFPHIHKGILLWDIDLVLGVVLGDGNK